MTTLKQQLEEWERHEARCWLRWLGPGGTPFEATEVTPGICSLCGAPGIGDGHDAAPYRGRCCEDCYKEVVMPARGVAERSR